MNNSNSGLEQEEELFQEKDLLKMKMISVWYVKKIASWLYITEKYNIYFFFFFSPPPLSSYVDGIVNLVCTIHALEANVIVNLVYIFHSQNMEDVRENQLI